MVDRRKIANKIQIAVLALFIVFMPLGSWYYLQSGYNYHENLMAELRDYGALPEFVLLTQNNDTLVNADLHGKIMIANFYNENTPNAAISMDYARRILGQFKSQKDLLFLFHNLNPEIQNDSLLKATAENEDLMDSRAYFLSGDQNQLTNLLVSGYRIPELENRNEKDSITFKNNVSNLPDDYPYFVLVDSSLTIRNYYDINDETSMNSLVEHLAIILPREIKSKAQHRPQKKSNMENLKLARKLNIVAGVLTVVVLLLVGMMRRPEFKIETDIDFSFLPPFHASLNALVAVVLLFALYFIKNKNIEAHKKSIYTAMVLSAMFLLSYVVYHFTTEETRYCFEGTSKNIYFFLLITHVVLAGVMLPFILLTFIRAFTGQIEKHRKMARWVWPFWFYVAITGPICYLMLRPCY